jgi:Flp pilus assembly protein CpaB
MEATTSNSRIGGSPLGQLVTSRRGGLMIALIAAVIAGGALFIFVRQYRKSVDHAAAQVPVIVASGFIPHGTPAAVISSQNLLQRQSLKQSAALQGAISDPSQLAGEVAIRDISPGQQLQAADFAPGNPTLSSYLTGTERAIELPVDSAHGLGGFITVGDHVDVFATTNGGAGTAGAAVTIAQGLKVLNVVGTSGGIVGGSGGGGVSGIIVQASDKQALALALAADSGKIWFVLEPPVAAQQTVNVGAKAGK